MNTSATGGYIKEPDVVPQREVLENAVHDMIAGLTGIGETLIRPAFQENPLGEPGPDVNWCGFYIRDAAPPGFPYVGHDPGGGGSDAVADWVDKEIHLYFYGPLSGEYAGMVRRGIHIEQNFLELKKTGIVVKRAGNVSQMPEQVKDKWLPRADLIIYATFAAAAGYPVLSLTQVSDGGQNWDVTQPDGETVFEEDRPDYGTFLNINR